MKTNARIGCLSIVVSTYAVLALSVMGCGGIDTPPGTTPALIAEWNGAWVGPRDVWSEGERVTGAQVNANITVTGTTAVVDSLCPAPLSFDGDVQRAEWHGATECPLPLPGCESASVELTSAIAVLYLDTLSINITAQGLLNGCGRTRAATFVFTASHPQGFTGPPSP